MITAENIYLTNNPVKNIIQQTRLYPQTVDGLEQQTNNIRNMKNIILILFITCSITTNDLFCQAVLKTGDKAPDINITDYISNIPKDKTIVNKYVLLEFWTTWCAPCLGAVLHLNQLQYKYKDKKDLLFISMTYESPEKVLKTLERIKFMTLVVSDQTQKSHIDFGAIQDGVMTLPRTVLIDNKGIVKWIGRPDQMTDSLFESFLEGAEITITQTLEPRRIENIAMPDLKDENTTDIAMQLIRDKQIQYSFSLLKSVDTRGCSISRRLSKGYFIVINYSFKTIISELLKVPEMQIVISERINDQKYSLFYTNVNITDENTCIEDIKTNLLKSLNLREKTESRLAEVYLLKVMDKNKLQLSKEKNLESHWGENDTHLIFSNIRFEQVIKEVSNLQRMNIIDETNLIDNYDFILRKDSKEDIIKDLETYGLTLEKVNRSIEYYIFE